MIGLGLGVPFGRGRGGRGGINKIVEIDLTLKSVTSIGDSNNAIQESMKRCILNDDGTINHYLDAVNSHNKDGIAPSITGTAETASAIYKLKDTGAFASGVVSGQYVKNTTKNTYHKILAVDSADEVSLLYQLATTDDKWGTADGTTASHLIDSSVNFETLGVTVGMIAFNRTDNTFATITNVTATDLTLDADIFISGESWSIISDCFEAGDGYEIQTAIFDESEGNVMVEIPKFYYYYDYSGTTVTIGISDTAKEGYAVHPAFTPGGVEKDYIYVGALEATRTDIDTFIYQGVNAFLNTSASTYVIGSQAGMQPITRGRRYIARDTAEARGTGWQLLDQYTWHAVQILFLTEFASFDSQSEIGEGFTDWNATFSESLAYNNRYSSIHTGWSLKHGNATANLSKGDRNIGSYMSYRGLENVYGSLNQIIDGINIASNSKVYLSNNPSAYANSVFTDDYIEIGTLTDGINGLFNEIDNMPFMFFPLTASSASLIPDGAKHNTGDERIAIVSGTDGYRANAGMFTISATTGYLGDRQEYNGFRVVKR